ncbi:hypothetical protein AXF42_Ash005979 [Apostasia shenzhenica]|uniref:Uncharacterized protein n=1 Tax=Apostasia shenzhenica TaxID=1088818 RepID=A0A2I0AZV2_9ASPA|nr:hypothetical protein AXF42_Ash005979 [Apostasia shenzhenica]
MFPARRQSARLVELADRTILECATICRCCPCGIVNLIILTVLRLPAGFCRRALRNRTLRRRSKKIRHRRPDSVVIAACEFPEHVRQRQEEPQHGDNPDRSVASHGEETTRKQGKPELKSKKVRNPRTHPRSHRCGMRVPGRRREGQQATQ